MTKEARNSRLLVLCLLNGWCFVAPRLAWAEARGGSIPRSGAVTDEQRSHRPTWGRHNTRISRHSVARVLSRACHGLRGLDQPFEAAAILDVIGAHGGVVRFGAGVVEDDHHVRLD